MTDLPKDWTKETCRFCGGLFDNTGYCGGCRCYAIDKRFIGGSIYD